MNTNILKEYSLNGYFTIKNVFSSADIYDLKNESVTTVSRRSCK